MIPAAADGHHDDAPSRDLLSWCGLAVGWGVMAFAVWGILSDPGATNPPQLARWVIGAALVHDLLVAPVVTAVAVLLARRAPAWWGRPVGAAAAASAVVVVFSTPLVRRFGARPLNPSALARDYGTNLIGVLLAIWAATAAVIVVRAVGRRRSS